MKSSFFSPSFLHLWAVHKQLPEQTGAVVLNHRSDGALVDGKVAWERPLRLFAKGIVEAVFAPNPAAFLPESLQRSHRLLRSVGERREGGGGGDHAQVVVGRVCRVAAYRIACGQAPAAVSRLACGWKYELLR